MSSSLPEQWLNRAKEDLAVAHLVLEEEYPAHTCFLAQQCMEKSLKAYLLVRSNTYPRTHKLVDLLVQCQKFEPDFSQFRIDCTIIDQYYLPTRYPDGVPGGAPGGLPGETEANEALAAAEQLLQFVVERVG